MIKKSLALVALTLSMAANALIINLDNITRDSDTGPDWLDVTATDGRSYNDISCKLLSGQGFGGWLC